MVESNVVTCLWMKGAGPAGVMNLAVVSEAPCGMTGVNLAAHSGEWGMLGQGGGRGMGTARSGVAMGAEASPPRGEQKILLSGAGGRPSGTGSGRGNKAWVGSHRNSCREGGSSGRMMGTGGGLKLAGAGLYSRTAGAMGDKLALTNGADQVQGNSGRAASVGAGCGRCGTVTTRMTVGIGDDPSHDKRKILSSGGGSCGKFAIVATSGIGKAQGSGRGVGDCGASAGDQGRGATRAKGIGDRGTTGNAAKGKATGSGEAGVTGAAGSIRQTWGKTNAAGGRGNGNFGSETGPDRGVQSSRAVGAPDHGNMSTSAGTSNAASDGNSEAAGTGESLDTGAAAGTRGGAWRESLWAMTTDAGSDVRLSRATVNIRISSSRGRQTNLALSRWRGSSGAGSTGSSRSWVGSGKGHKASGNGVRGTITVYVTAGVRAGPSRDKLNGFSSGQGRGRSACANGSDAELRAGKGIGEMGAATRTLTGNIGRVHGSDDMAAEGNGLA